MCRPHWKLVPEDLKRKMRAAFANIGATDPIAWDKITNKIKPSEANDRLKIYYTLEKEAVSSIMSKKVTSLK
jgi:hypothetical protein